MSKNGDLDQSRKILISVVVPHLRQPEGLENCLSSLAKQTLAEDLFEILVVDNGSPIPPHAVVARYPRARLLSEPRPGPGPARNAGAESAVGEILAFIDADCRADPDWLRTVAQTLSSAAPRTILGGDVRIWRGSNA